MDWRYFILFFNKMTDLTVRFGYKATPLFSAIHR